MIDYRENRRKAKELVDSGKMLTFRMILPNGNIAERHLVPTEHTPGSDYFYKDTRYIFKLPGKTNVPLQTVGKMELPPQTTKNGAIYNFVEELLKDYTYCE